MSSFTRSISILYSFLISINIVAWIFAFHFFHHSSVLMGTAFLAWIFGLRHAVDADHIAAIDNVVRQLTGQYKPSLSTGLWFALGHSTIVIIASILIVLSTASIKPNIALYQTIGETIGTIVSGLFLLSIALANFFTLLKLWDTFKQAQRNKHHSQQELENLLNSRGFLARFLKPIFRMVSKAWHMYPVGFLFGLGFDTATEIGLLGIAAVQAAHGMSPWQIMIFPALFTAGMILIDTTDSVVMTGAYNWAFKEPIRKIWYNMTMTGISIFVAIVIGGLEILGLIQNELNLSGFFWNIIAHMQDHLGYVGFMIIGVFIACWLTSILLFRRFFSKEISSQ